jgi:alkanesulfonate monooxygenase SsuD/methylene tetrahydromethanopterin reductase-like flavin-dependent oxidoreductase (luciferase family)
MAAMAISTERVTLGAVITPPSRRRPWKLAREAMTVDHLSDGRLVLPVGLGAIDDGAFGKVGEPTAAKTRAELLDESLAILDGLWSGEPFSFTGKHYRIAEMTFRPPPIQRPRIPIWVVGAWPSERSMARALRWDGLLVQPPGGEGSIDDARAIAAYVSERRDQARPLDLIWPGVTDGANPAAARAAVAPFAEAGFTWWLESMWDASGVEPVRARLRQGPPD